TRFRSGDINAVDFTVYFDRPLYQTAHGRLMLVETADLPDFSHRSQFAVHAYYNLLLLAPLYRIAATPYWLLALSVVSVTLAAVGVAPRDRWLYLVTPPAIGLANLLAYYAAVLPTFASSSNPVYAAFWGDFGPTPARALLGMVSRPIDVAGRVLTSGLP